MPLEVFPQLSALKRYPSNKYISLGSGWLVSNHERKVPGQQLYETVIRVEVLELHFAASLSNQWADQRQLTSVYCRKKMVRHVISEALEKH